MSNTPPSNTEKPSGADWKFRLLGALSEHCAPRVFTTAEFQDFVHRIRPGYVSSATRKFADALTQAGALQKVSSGAYLNKRAVPPAELVEIASRVRAGAVVSLHSVLGECGFLNNPTDNVIAVVPTSAQHRPTLGETKTSGGAVFRFYGLAPRFFPANDQERWDLLQAGRPCDMFRPEAALLQWLYLARNQRSTLTALPTDVDMQAIDIDRVNILSSRWGLSSDWEQWHERASSLGFGEQKHNYAQGHQVSPVPLVRADARSRVLARRQPIGVLPSHDDAEPDPEPPRQRMLG